MSELTDFHRAKDDFFKNDPQSPLSQAQKEAFSGLKYYPENIQLRFNLPIEKTEKMEHVILATSTGDEQEYVHVGQIRFSVGDRMRFCRCMFLREDLIISSHLWTQLPQRKPTAQGVILNPETWAAGNYPWISTWPIILIAPTMITGPARCHQVRTGFLYASRRARRSFTIRH